MGRVDRAVDLAVQQPPARSRAKRCSRRQRPGLDGIAAVLAGAEAVALTEVALEAADDAAARRESGEFGGGALLENLASNAARSGVGGAATVSALDWVDALDANFAPAARYDFVGADLVHDEKYCSTRSPPPFPRTPRAAASRT